MESEVLVELLGGCASHTLAVVVCIEMGGGEGEWGMYGGVVVGLQNCGVWGTCAPLCGMHTPSRACPP